MNGCSVTNILDLLGDGKGAISKDNETAVQELISTFSCPLNAEIEYFLYHNAIEFAKRKQCITYFVRDQQYNLLAYFALTHKAVNIDSARLSNTVKKGISRHAEQNVDTGTFNASAFLLAQFGKNAAYDGKQGISGNELMSLALEVLCSAQHLVGGGIVYLECEDEPSLMSFYANDFNRFREFGERDARSEGILYRQFLRLF